MAGFITVYLVAVCNPKLIAVCIRYLPGIFDPSWGTDMIKLVFPWRYSAYSFAPYITSGSKRVSKFASHRKKIKTWAKDFCP